MEENSGAIEYKAIKERISKLSEKDRRFFNRVETINTRRCGFTCSEMLLVAKIYNNNALNSFNFIFKIGFIREKNQKNKKTNKKRYTL